MSAGNYPAKRTAIGALMVAPLLPVGILLALDAFDRAQQQGPLAIVGAAMLAFYMLIVVEAFSIALGGLAISLLWGRVPFNIFICMAAGGLVAVLPFLLIGVISGAGEPINYDAWVDGRATVVDGVKTAYGRWRDLLAMLQIFGLGVVGGAFFWWLCRSKRHADATPE